MTCSFCVTLSVFPLSIGPECFSLPGSWLNVFIVTPQEDFGQQPSTLLLQYIRVCVCVCVCACVWVCVW